MSYRRHAMGSWPNSPPNVGEILGVHPSTRASGIAGAVLMNTVYAQRGLNAVGRRVIVDGIAGPNTLAALRAYWSSKSAETRGVEPALQSVTTATVLVPNWMDGNFSLAARVADPPGSTVAANSWTAPARSSSSSSSSTSSSGTSSGEKTGGSSPTTYSPSEMLESGESRMDITPWIVGAGAALAFLIGAGLYVSRKKKPTKNRRRRRSR